MVTAYATKRSLWHLCAEFVKVPAMRDTDFIKLTPDSFLLKWHDEKGNHTAEYRYWVGMPTLRICDTTSDVVVIGKTYILNDKIIAGIGMKKVST